MNARDFPRPSRMKMPRRPGAAFVATTPDQMVVPCSVRLVDWISRLTVRMSRASPRQGAPDRLGASAPFDVIRPLECAPHRHDPARSSVHSLTGLHCRSSRQMAQNVENGSIRIDHEASDERPMARQ